MTPSEWGVVLNALRIQAQSVCHKSHMLQTVSGETVELKGD